MKRIFRIGLVVLFIASMLFTAVSDVHAAAAGRQISVSACSAVRITIQGKNQAGVMVTYTLNKTATNCGVIYITGKWWQGPVTVNAYYNVSAEYPFYKGQTKSITVPATASSAYTPVSFAKPSTRLWMMWRAQTWVIDKVPYNQSATRDGYRQDCSGYVSYVWQITKPGTSPGGLKSYSYQIPFDSLMAGDALNNPSAHSMLFVAWVDKSKGTFIAYEEGNPASGTKQRTLTLNKSTGVIKQNIFYTYPGTYKAMRKNGL